MVQKSFYIWPKKLKTPKKHLYLHQFISMKIMRQFSVLDKETEELIDEIPIPDFSLEEVKKIIKPSQYDLNLYDCYKITGCLKEYFESIGFCFDTDNKLYFLCCYKIHE
ncbi:DUF7683 domain-containing protein [Sabulibacter ruber]|uniref:DUF7683 domain-containing protein n=1 Tax=Sabulibacter ruber TaxID=2811901 RepID=UPI003BF98A68